MMPEFYFDWLLSVLYHIHGHVDTVDWESDQHPGWEMYQLELNSRTAGLFLYGIWKGACAFSYTFLCPLTSTLSQRPTCHIELWYMTVSFLGFFFLHQMHPLPPTHPFSGVCVPSLICHRLRLLNYPEKKNSITLSLACSFLLLPFSNMEFCHLCHPVMCQFASAVLSSVPEHRLNQDSLFKQRSICFKNSHLFKARQY